MQTNIKRLEKVKFRKGLIPAILLSITFIFLTGYFMYKTDPDKQWALQIFLLLVFLASYFTFSVIFTKNRRGLIGAIIFVIILFLRYIGLKNILLPIPLIMIGLLIESFYLWKNKRKTGFTIKKLSAN
jgi:tryptophan-rich sensory protein